jgi:inosine/xanthosine triphosphatase
VDIVVCAGTRNPSKIKGIEKAFKEFYNNVSILPTPVPLNIPPQPIGFNQMFEGSRIRAIKCLERVSECELGVGVEAGIYKINDIWFNAQVAAIADRSGYITYGFSPSFQIPPTFAERLLKGIDIELENIIDRYFGTVNIGDKGGFIKLLTNGLVLREDLAYYSVIMALIPRLNRELFEMK